MDRFYCVFVEGTRGGTHFKHPTKPEAEEEAERLARETGKTVYILEAIALCELQEFVPPVVWHSMEQPRNDKGQFISTK